MFKFSQKLRVLNTQQMTESFLQPREEAGWGMGRRRAADLSPFPAQTRRLSHVGNKQKNRGNVHSSETHVLMHVWELGGDSFPEEKKMTHLLIFRNHLYITNNEINALFSFKDAQIFKKFYHI